MNFKSRNNKSIIYLLVILVIVSPLHYHGKNHPASMMMMVLGVSSFSFRHAGDGGDTITKRRRIQSLPSSSSLSLSLQRLTPGGVFIPMRTGQRLTSAVLHSKKNHLEEEKEGDDTIISSSSSPAAPAAAPSVYQKSIIDEQEEHQEFDSLEVILEKARKRPTSIMLLPYKIQAFMNKPLIIIPTIQSSPSSSSSSPSVITLGDVAFVLFAIKLDSLGFAVGYTIGKLTTPYLREQKVIPIPIALIELWTLFFATFLGIILDQVWRNID